MQNRKLVNFRESRQFNTRRVSLPPCSKPSVAHEMLRCAAMYSAFKMHLFIRNHFFLKIFFLKSLQHCKKSHSQQPLSYFSILSLVHWQHFKRLSTLSVEMVFWFIFAFLKNQFKSVKMKLIFSID